MELPYHLLEYRNKLGALSPQALSILKFIIEQNECRKFQKRIKKEKVLSLETLQVLNRGILAGYSNTIYTYSWDREEELKFWQIVNSKSKQIGLSYWILANNGRWKKSLKALKDVYFKAFELSPSTIFAVEESDRKLFYEDPELRYTFLSYEVNAVVGLWENFEEDYQEQWPYWEKVFGEDKRAMAIIKEIVEAKRKM